MDVRAMRAADGAAVADVLEAAIRAAPSPGESVAEARRAGALFAGDPTGTAVALDEGRVVGVTRPSDALLTVDPAFRRRGHGSRLLDVAREIARAAGRHELELAVPPHGPGRPFAERRGLRPKSSLWLLELPAVAPSPADTLPVGYVGRDLRPDADFARYVDLLNASFADHPSPMSWTPEFIRNAHALPGFDPADTRIVTTDADEDRLVAFCRVSRLEADDGTCVGSIRLVGTVPAARRHGIGAALVGWGVRRLRASGAERVELTVEARNDQALGLYRRIGFVPVIEWPRWVLPISP
jgi:mycothiol synthase